MTTSPLNCRCLTLAIAVSPHTGIVNKLLHGPMTHLRATENLDKNLAALKTLKAIFEI